MGFREADKCLAKAELKYMQATFQNVVMAFPDFFISFAMTLKKNSGLNLSI